MNGEDNLRASFARPVPVYVVYATAVAREGAPVGSGVFIYEARANGRAIGTNRVVMTR